VRRRADDIRRTRQRLGSATPRAAATCLQLHVIVCLAACPRATPPSLNGERCSVSLNALLVMRLRSDAGRRSCRRGHSAACARIAFSEDVSTLHRRRRNAHKGRAGCRRLEAHRCHRRRSPARQRTRRAAPRATNRRVASVPSARHWPPVMAIRPGGLLTAPAAAAGDQQLANNLQRLVAGCSEGGSLSRPTCIGTLAASGSSCRSGGRRA